MVRCGRRDRQNGGSCQDTICTKSDWLYAYRESAHCPVRIPDREKARRKFILRIEDTDQERYVEGATDVVYKTLRIAGLEHDEGPDKGGIRMVLTYRAGVKIYTWNMQKLIDLGHAYYCFCSRERLAALKEESERQGKQYKYDRHCLNLTSEETERKLAEGVPFVIRQKMPDTGSTSFEDAVYGTITVDNSELEDQILIKSDGLPTYNFANVIDDHLMEITHVVRGNEYLSSTQVQPAVQGVRMGDTRLCARIHHYHPGRPQTVKTAWRSFLRGSHQPGVPA